MAVCSVLKEETVERANPGSVTCEIEVGKDAGKVRVTRTRLRGVKVARL
ncbi:MAG: hypothetical protein HPY55_05400 [Firmicutes bacterium]|nr:hypothetical protein [Bacillota bacterium]